ncbi:unnamed protein product [Chondrus crispus]|uniref:Uncharacterized protein n=1 Tax=Chondrus crispus TaxID=2769 RepID=R7QKY8_CHOCR|nr:unnamed protein product [Chondrus crispus]CDF38146.1 unnamed protein product [Chondrus crispus]|eukprot:XP_005718015.1 unnamed protein product [Chondrus crispus]
MLSSHNPTAATGHPHLHIFRNSRTPHAPRLTPIAPTSPLPRRRSPLPSNRLSAASAFPRRSRCNCPFGH